MTSGEVARLAMAVLLGVAGAWCALTNWVALAVSARGRHMSTVPLIGGLLGATALALAPGDASDWWWVAFVADYGSLPWLALIAYVLGRDAIQRKSRAARARDM
jgi:hypothetical protein